MTLTIYTTKHMFAINRSFVSVKVSVFILLMVESLVPYVHIVHLAPRIMTGTWSFPKKSFENQIKQWYQFWVKAVFLNMLKKKVNYFCLKITIPFFLHVIDKAELNQVSSTQLYSISLFFLQSFFTIVDQPLQYNLNIYFDLYS